MARARNIKPRFFHDANLLRCPPLVRLLFAGLWTIADREGRLKDDPDQIKLDCLPLDNCNVEDMLTQLETQGLIRRYMDGLDQHYIAIRTFSKHQNPHKNEPQSTIPAPEFSSNGERCNDDSDANPDYSDANRADSFILIPDSQDKTHAQQNPLSALQQVWFDNEFWPLAWRKTDKQEALKAFRKKATSPAAKDKIIAGVNRDKPAIMQRELDRRPYMSTWLNKGRVDDEPDIPPEKLAPEPERTPEETQKILETPVQTIEEFQEQLRVMDADAKAQARERARKAMR